MMSPDPRPGVTWLCKFAPLQLCFSHKFRCLPVVVRLISYISSDPYTNYQSITSISFYNGENTYVLSNLRSLAHVLDIFYVRDVYKYYFESIGWQRSHDDLHMTHHARSGQGQFKQAKIRHIGRVMARLMKANNGVCMVQNLLKQEGLGLTSPKQ